MPAVPAQPNLTLCILASGASAMGIHLHKRQDKSSMLRHMLPHAIVAAHQ